jgi:hypothetical protein
MKLIATNKALENVLSRLVKTYPNVAFAVAWATANTSIFRQLTAQPSRIKRAIIGTHFYQAHPDVLDTFVGSTVVRFMLQPNVLRSGAARSQGWANYLGRPPEARL